MLYNLTAASANLILQSPQKPKESVPTSTAVNTPGAKRHRLLTAHPDFLCLPFQLLVRKKQPFFFINLNIFWRLQI